MRKTLIFLLIILLIIAFIKYNPFKREKKDEPTVISSLFELFPSKKMTQTFKQGDSKYQVKVVEVKKEENVVTVITEQEMTFDDEVTIIEMTYQITNEKIIESGRHISNGKVVSTIYPTELLVGMPYENMTWKTSDELTTYKVTSMKNNQVTIENVRMIDTYEEGKRTPVKKEYKEIRVFEKGKGIVLFRTEIVGDSSSVVETRLVK